MVDAQSSTQSIKQTNVSAQKLDPVRAIDYSNKPTGGITGGIVVKGKDAWKNSPSYGSSSHRRNTPKTSNDNTTPSQPAPVEIVSSSYGANETKALVEAQGYRLKPASNSSSPFYNVNAGQELLNKATDFNNPTGATIQQYKPQAQPLTKSQFVLSALESVPQAYAESLITTGKVAGSDFYNVATSGPRAISKTLGIPTFEVGSVASPVINVLENYKPSREERTTAYINIIGFGVGAVAGGAFGGVLGSVPVRASAVGVGSALYGTSIATSIYNFKTNPTPKTAGGVVAVLAPGALAVGYNFASRNQVPVFEVKQSEAPITRVKQVGDNTFQIETYGKAELKQVGVYGSEKSSFVTQSTYNLDSGFVSDIKIRGAIGNAKSSTPFAKVASVKGTLVYDTEGYAIGEGNFYARDAFTNAQYSSGVYKFAGSKNIVLGATLSKDFGIVDNKISFKPAVTKGSSINYPNAMDNVNAQSFEIIPSQGSANQYYGINKQISQVGILQNTIGSSTIPKGQAFNAQLALAPVIFPVAPSPQNRNYLPNELFQIPKQENKNYLPSGFGLSTQQETPTTRVFTPNVQPTTTVINPSPSRVRPTIQIAPPTQYQPPLSPTLTKQTEVPTSAPPYFNPIVPTNQQSSNPSPSFSFSMVGSDNYLSSNVITGARKRTRYTPSFSALLYNIKGKKNIKTETGINFRPIPKGYNLLRWNKKR